MPETDFAEDQTLRAERDHMVAARAELTRMRDEARSLQTHDGEWYERLADIRAQAAGATTFVSDEVLASELANRTISLADDGKTPLFFGRIDHGDDSPYPGERVSTSAAGTSRTRPAIRW
ncbi:hypothetical protein [Fodinicola feengrottensis]|uniref:hypothetical protein n=1 Tax=Fodinicola feengrottensis TaxID=435914 RepID=UPI0024429B66|nr:hypothetical protein [Fodinicola feengrottensis]